MKKYHLPYKEAITNWLVVYPLITLLLWLLNPWISSWPLPAKTLLLTALVVPIMSFWALPLAFYLQKKYLKHFLSNH